MSKSYDLQKNSSNSKSDMSQGKYKTSDKAKNDRDAKIDNIYGKNSSSGQNQKNINDKIYGTKN